MARKTVITKVLDVNAQDGIIEFPQNKTLYADQFTDNPPVSDEEREGFKPASMNDVFEHYKPSKENVTLETEDGGAVQEDFVFKSLKDFEDEQLISQSELLSAAQGDIDALNAVIYKLEHNKPLRNVLKDKEARVNLRKALGAMLDELEQN